MELDADVDDSKKMTDKITNVRKKINDLKNAIEKGDLDEVKSVTDYLDEKILSDKILLDEIKKSNERVGNLDLIISACNYKQYYILYYLLYETQILHLLDDTSDLDQLVDQRITTITCAIKSGDFTMVEMLYDYWCSNTYWPGCQNSEHMINTIRRIEIILNNVYKSCKKDLVKNQQMEIDFHCLLTFNKFQRAVYEILHKMKSKVNDPNDTKNTIKVIGTMLLNILSIYDKYSNLEEVRIPNAIHEQEQMIKSMLNDPRSVYRKGLAYLMYEVYFRKLDFTISLIILENIDVIRRHLKKRFNVNKKSKRDSNASSNLNPCYVNAAKLFEEIESMLYYFIYRTFEDWRLYLPRNRPMTTKHNYPGVYEGQRIPLELKYDSQKILNGAVIFFERKQFKNYLKKFKKVIKRYVIISRPPYEQQVIKQNKNTENRKNDGQNDQEDLLDDNYLKPLQYMRDHYSLKKIVYYIVEGSMKPRQLDILAIERVLQVIGEMLKCSNLSLHLSPSTKALLQTEFSVETIDHLHSIREYLSHTDKGQLTRRQDLSSDDMQTFFNIQKDLKEIFNRLHPILDIYQCVLDKFLLDSGLCILHKRLKKYSDDFTYYDLNWDIFNDQTVINNIIRKHDITIELLKEIVWIKDNEKTLQHKRNETCSRMATRIVAVLPKYIENVYNLKNLILNNNSNWDTIKSELKNYNIRNIPEFPKKKQLIDITIKLNGFMKRNKTQNEVLLNKLKEMKDLSIAWFSIINLINFLSIELEYPVFKDISKTFKFDIKDKLPNAQVLNSLQEILDKMDCWCQKQPRIFNTNSSRIEHEFKAIQELDVNIYSIKNNIKEVPFKIKTDEVMVCLLQRISILKQTLKYSKNIQINQLLLKYKRNQKFKIKLEMLLVDIGNILSQRKIRLMNKSTKLLQGINVGNVLDHGNPFLEVIGDVLDSLDFPTELLSKAIMFAEDENSIDALHKLFREDVNFETIKLHDLSNLDETQQEYLATFKSSVRWHAYLYLVKMGVKK